MARSGVNKEAIIDALYTSQFKLQKPLYFS